MTTTGKREILDIVALVEKNPLTRLTGNYGSKIIQRIRDSFTTDEEQLLVGGMYCYLNYNPKLDFVVYLDLIWKWMGYNRINDCKRCLTTNFKENVDYKIENFALQDGKAKTNPVEGEQETRGGHNKESIVMTINCFKKLCLKSKTDKADQIHDYYIKLEDLIMELVTEQTAELQSKLQIKDNIIQQKEQNFLTNFHKKPIVYVGIAEYCKDGTIIVKAGYTNNMKQRLDDHKHDIRSDFTFEYVYESIYNREIERKLFRSQEMVKRRLQKVYYGREEAQTELFRLDKDFTIYDLDKLVQLVKNKVESGEHDDLIDEINALELDNVKLRLELSKNDSTKFDDLKNENNTLKLENNKLIFEIERLKDELKSKITVINETNAETVTIQLNSMQDLNLKLHTIKKAVCYNFLIDFVVKNINESEIKLSVHEIFELYKKFRISNGYKDIINDEIFENSLITQAFNKVDGIKNTFKTTNGVSARAKLFNIRKISHWICENIQVPKRFRNIFREISKQVVFTDTYCEILNKEIDFRHSSSYSFLIHLILKYKTDEPTIIVKHTIFIEEYLKFMLQFSQPKLYIPSLIDILM